MIALDTNVLIRFIVQDDKRQARAAEKLIVRCSADDPGFVNLIVLCEITWVLKSGYGYDRKVLSAVVRGILSSVELLVEESESVWQALRIFESGSADFADCLTGVHNKNKQSATTYTFDATAAKTPGFTPVPP
jgi:predicted nucleic-acid-binding protein